MPTVVFLLYYAVPIVFAGEHPHPIPTYFFRQNPDSSLLDVRSVQTPLKDGFIITQNISSSAILNVQPNPCRNSEFVSISWSSIDHATSDDFVAYYCPLDTPHDGFLDYLPASDTTMWFEGRGSLYLRLYNMREICEFRYYRRSSDGFQLVARSEPVVVDEGPLTPLQAHLALTNKTGEMRISWASGDDSPPLVMYGKVGLSPRTVQGTTNTYTASDMCSSPASDVGFFKPGLLHTAVMTGLEPDTEYFYQYGSRKATSPVRSFRSAPKPGLQREYRFLIYGDMGMTGTPGAWSTAAHCTEEVRLHKAELVFHIGDISYARGWAYVWDQWMALIEPYASAIPYMVGIGNHEQDHTTGGEKDPSGAGNGFHPSWGNYGNDSGGECGVPMFRRFPMPENGHAPWWYSYNYGLVHFIIMSTEHDYSPSSPQYVWLEKDLAAVNRNVTPWVVLGGHRPMYTSQNIRSDFVISQHMQELFENLLHEYAVDVAFWAHYHSYERTCPLYKNRCVSTGGTTHIVVGSAGKELDDSGWMGFDWSVYRAIDWGYGRLIVSNATAARWEWVRNRDDVVADSVWIYHSV